MLTAIRKSAMAVAALAALGLGAAAIAGAADKNQSSATSSSTQADPGRPGPGGPDRAGPDREALSSDVAALDKLPGATVLRTEAGGPYSSAYHAHIRTSDGTSKVVLVNSSFQATAVQADQGPRGRGRHGGPGDHDGPGGRGGRGETALTGDRKQKVEAAVLARYSGATIVRTETNDGSALYESHIKTSAGEELEVHVSKDFAVVDAREQPAHP